MPKLEQRPSLHDRLFKIPMSNKSAGVLGKVMLVVAVAGMMAVTNRIEGPLLAAGNLVCAALLVISTWINTTVKLSRSSDAEFAPDKN